MTCTGDNVRGKVFFIGYTKYCFKVDFINGKFLYEKNPSCSNQEWIGSRDVTLGTFDSFDENDAAVWNRDGENSLVMSFIMDPEVTELSFDDTFDVGQINEMKELKIKLPSCTVCHLKNVHLQ
jgi:hypothetical protein